nr:hypothetical protein [uncultured Holophaga sp.]
MSDPSKTGPIPLPPQEPIDATLRLPIGEAAPHTLGTQPIPVEQPASSPFETQTIQTVQDPAETITLRSLPEIPEALAPEFALPEEPAPHPAASTQDIPSLFPDPTETLTLQGLPEVPEALPEEPATPPPAPLPPPVPRRSGMGRGILIGIVIVLVILGIGGFVAYRMGAFGTRPEARDEALGTAEKPVVNATVQPYLQRAEAGDTTAMEMLGHFYYYGLNVPQNREEGLRWFRMAASAGSPSAQKTLEALEGKLKQ